MTTIVELSAVRKRGFTLPVTYKASDVNIPDTRVARNGDTRVARNGNTRVAHNLYTINEKQVLQARKRNFTKSVVVLNG